MQFVLISYIISHIFIIYIKIKIIICEIYFFYIYTVYIMISCVFRAS